MIVKILGSAGSNFNGIRYNEKKVESGKGELMLMKNFPFFISEDSKPEEVRNYLKAISKNDKVKKPQFHAVISTKFREQSKEELARVAEEFMNEMGYGQQPYIAVFHNDTENNHIHLVSTRVDKQTGKKIKDNFEKLKAQQALSKTLEKIYGISQDEELNQLLDYKTGSLHQLETLLQRSGYRLVQNTNDEKEYQVLRNGVFQRSITGRQLVFYNTKDDKRAQQIKAILHKYKGLASNKVFRVEDRREQQSKLPEDKHQDFWKPKIEYESELQKKLRDIFGIDIVFHFKDDKMPFGYTLIDHKTGTVYKGSDLIKMNELFELTTDSINKKWFESLKDYNIADEDSKKVLMAMLKRQNPEHPIREFMLFKTNKWKNKELLNKIRNDVKEYLKTQSQKDIGIIKSEEGIYYAVHFRQHYIGRLETLIGEKEYQRFLNQSLVHQIKEEQKAEAISKELNQSISELMFECSKNSGGAKDPSEDDWKKRKRRRR